MTRAFGSKFMLGMMVVLLVAGTADAGNSIQSLIDFSNASPVGNKNIGDDNSREYVLVDKNGNNILDVGDVLRGILEIDKIENQFGTTSIGEGTSNNEWTAIFEAEIWGKSATADTNGQYDFSFGPSASFAEAAALFGAGSGAMILFYEDAAQNYSVTNGYDADGTPGAPYTWNGSQGTGPNSDEANAVDGTFTWALGFTGAMDDTVGDGVAASGDEYTTAGEGWTATAFDTPFATTLTSLGTGNFNFNRILGGGGSFDSWYLEAWTSGFDGVSDVEFRGDTQFEIGSFPAVWPIKNQATFEFNAIAVPLPSAVWAGLAMLGALGFGANRRRKRNV